MSLLFKITDVGLIASAQAVDMGIKVKLTNFKLGSGFGYIPNGQEVALAGSILYSDSISSYKNMPDGSLVAVCTVDVQAGPFDFGEIGLYTDTGVLFAVATLPQRQTKYTSLGSNVNSTFTFNCHMRLAQSLGIFEISAIDQAACELYVGWKDIKPPIDMPDPRVTRLLVTDQDNHDDVSALVQTPDGGWSIQSNLRCVGPSVAVTAVNLTYVELSSAVWRYAFPGLVATTVAAVANSTVVVQMPNATFRKAVASVVGLAVRLTFTDPLTTPLDIADRISIWCNDVPNVVGVVGTNGNYTTVSGNGTPFSPLRYDIDVAALAAAIFAAVDCADLAALTSRCSLTPVGSPVGSPVGKVGSPVG